MNSAIAGRSIPEPGFFEKYGVNVMDTDDIQWMPITGHLTYPAAGIQQLTFFANGRGQGTTSALNAPAGAQSYADTNLDGNGVLSTPERALILAIGISVFPGILPAIGADALADTGLFINDLYQIGRSGFLEWKIGNKTIALDTPLQKFGTGEGLDVMAALSDSTTAGATQLSQIAYGRFAGDAYSIVPVALISNQNFPLTLNWPALVPTPSTQPARIGVSLYGYRIRKAQ
jgi:hypothetical protein